MKKLFGILVLLPMISFVNSVGAKEINTNGYLLDSSGSVVKSGDGSCWRTGSYEEGKTYHPDCNKLEIKTVEKIKEEQIKEEKKVISKIIPVVTPTKYTSDKILFKFNSDKLPENSSLKLNSIISNLKGEKNYSILLIGHADPVGTEEYNENLSRERAENVADYLINGGLNPYSISIKAKGEIDPIVKCSGKGITICNQPNRRVDLFINSN